MTNRENLLAFLEEQQQISRTKREKRFRQQVNTAIVTLYDEGRVTYDEVDGTITLIEVQ